MNDDLKLDLIHQLNKIADRLEENWGNMTVLQVNQLKASIEQVWNCVCRRRK